MGSHGAVLNLPMEILIKILSCCNSRHELGAFREAHVVFEHAYQVSPVPIAISVILTELEALGCACGAQRLFDTAWKLELLRRRNAQQTHAKYESFEFSALPRVTALDDVLQISRQIDAEQAQVEDNRVRRYYLTMFNSHPGRLIELRLEQVPGVVLFFSLHLRLHHEEAAYYDAVFREDRTLVEGKDHPSKSFFEQFNYRELFLLSKCALESPIHFGHRGAAALREALERMRVLEGVEISQEDRLSLWFPIWAREGEVD
ncbi:hypothetical protein RUND412_006619 [Rhizina undulata]